MLEIPVDLLALRDASLGTLLDKAADVAAAGGPAAALTGLSELCVDEAVRLVREAATPELVEGLRALRTFLGGRRGHAARTLAPGAHDRLAGVLPMLTAASAPSSKGGDTLVLRSWNGKAQEALAKLAEAGGELGRAELRAKLNVSESYVSHLLSDLEGARLVERLTEPGRRHKTVHLTAEGRQLTPAMPSPTGNVIPFSGCERVPAARDEQLNRRVRNFANRGGAAGQFPMAARR